jgi:hypothetical protein
VVALKTSPKEDREERPVDQTIEIDEVNIVTNAIAYIVETYVQFGEVPEDKRDVIMPDEMIPVYRQAAIKAIAHLDSWRGQESMKRAEQAGLI